MTPGWTSGWIDLPYWTSGAINIGLFVFFLWLFGRAFVGSVISILTWTTREDMRRIRDDLAGQGAQLLSVTRTELAGSWLRRDFQRHYRLSYRDKNGWEHHATCQTSNRGGVYYADDQVAGQPPAAGAASDPAARIAELEKENRRLKEELRQREEG